MSNIAPSIHSRPPATADELAAVEHPAHRAVVAHDPVLELERLVAVARGQRDRLQHHVDVVRMDEAEDRAPLGGEEVGRRVARDPLDLVGDHLQRVVRVPGGAVDRARDVLHQRPQQPVVGALLRRAQPGAGARDQLGAGERAVEIVVGAGVEHRVGHPALGGDRDRQHPRVPEPRDPRAACRHTAGASRPDESRSTITRSTGSSSSAAPAASARRTARGACPAARNQDWISGSAAPTTNTPACRRRTASPRATPPIIAANGPSRGRAVEGEPLA